MAAMGPDAVAILLGAGLVTRSNDTEFPFRQASDFWYLTGFDHPGAIAVFRTDGGPAYTLFVQPRDPTAETWTGYRPGLEGALADYAADVAEDVDHFLDKLPDLLGAASRVFHSLGHRPEIDAKLVAIQEQRRLQSRQGVGLVEQILDPRTLLHEMRLFKSEDELAIMRRAAAISYDAHHEAARLIAPGRNEFEVEALLDYVFRRSGGSGPAYGSIVAGGAGAATLHYLANDQPLVDGELLLIDAGVELEGYASDVTRTYPVGQRFQGERKALYEAVLRSQLAALDLIAPGTTLPAIHDATVRSLVEGMVDIGLLQGDVDGLIETEAYRRYYMHGTSHWLGLDVHDAGSYAQGKTPRALEPSMVFTVEPGLYINANDEQAPAGFRGLGVRIEDDVVVTSDGCENLTAAIPKTSDDVEAWMRGD
jgi:Xaa-Pro aminopeptidase